MKNYLKIMIISSLVLLLGSCRKEEILSVKNMEDVYSEQGIPVQIRTIEQEDFSTYLKYTSSMKGLKESTGSSLISDTVEEILVKVGDYVEKNQPIIRFPESNPSANYFQAEAGFKAAEQAFGRIENMYNNNGVSRQSYDDARTQYEVQLANWETVRNLVEVKSPISGFITRINVNPSENVKPGDKLFTVSNYDQLTATIWVGDHEISNIQIGQKVTSNWETRTLSGMVTQVDLSKDAGKKAFAVKVQLDNSSYSVPSGVTADINIQTNLIKNSIILHRNEILGDENNRYVYLEQEGLATRQNIKTGLRQGMYYQIESGLSTNDRIITEGLSLVRENSLVKVMEESNLPLAMK